MSELFWKANCLRNWLWFTHVAHPLKVGVHCSSLGSVCYEIAGKATTLLLNGKQVAGASVPFSARDPRPAVLEGEKLHWSWTLFRGTVELKHRPSGRRVSFYTAHCVVQDHNREHRLDCAEVYLGQLAEPMRPERPSTRETGLPSAAEAPSRAPLQFVSPPSQAIPQEDARASHWTDEIPEEPFRRVLRHLERHGTINEEEVTDFLGSPRLARGFGNKLEDYRSLIPFQVDVDTRSGLKTYRKTDRPR